METIVRKNIIIDKNKINLHLFVGRYEGPYIKQDEYKEILLSRSKELVKLNYKYDYDKKRFYLGKNSYFQRTHTKKIFMDYYKKEQIEHFKKYKKMIISKVSMVFTFSLWGRDLWGFGDPLPWPGVIT